MILLAANNGRIRPLPPFATLWCIPSSTF